MFIIVMGVSGSGKTTVGKLLAERLNWPFYEGDAFHPPANIAKMAAGIPLTDQDRASWLKALTQLIQNGIESDSNGVIACSALKQAYRDELKAPAPQLVKFIYLKGSYDLILQRMQHRTDHYMKPDMLKSQFADLEEPTDALTVDISLPPEEIVGIIIEDVVEPGR